MMAMWGSLLVALAVAAVAPLAQGYTLPAPGNPITVAATKFDTCKICSYQGAQNPNPDVPASWNLVYDPKPMYSVIAIEMALIPGTADEFLFVYKSNPVRLGYRDAAAAVFDLSKSSKAGTVGNPDAPKGVQRNVSVESNPWCGHLIQMHDGRIMVAGGSDATPNDHTVGLKDVRIFDYRKAPATLPTVAQTRDGRWYPSLALLQDNTIMIQGGTTLVGETVPPSHWIERWNPATPKKMPLPSYPIDEQYLTAVGKNYFPLMVQLPTGEVLIQNDAELRIFKLDGTYRKDVTFPSYPAGVSNQWPRSGSIMLSALDAANDFMEASIIVMGGTPSVAKCLYGAPDNQVLARRNIYTLRIKMGFDAKGNPTYVFPDNAWLEDDMGIPRTGGDNIMLPSGDVVLLGGSQRGCHGGQGKNFAPGGTGQFTIEPRNSAPAFWPVLYQPDAPQGSRVTVMVASTIARVYHHSAALTMDGHIITAGCDECNASTYFADGVGALARDFWSPLSAGKREHRIEIFKTPFSLDENNRPWITSLLGKKDMYGNVTAGYGQVITITWKAFKQGNPLPDVTGVSLAAPAATTHSYNNNQRVIKLEIVSKTKTKDEGKVTVRLPPNASVAPRQYYQVFLLNKKTNSRAWWLRMGGPSKN